MRIALNLLMVGTVAAVLVVSAGCGKTGEAGSDGKTVAIRGGTEASSKDASSSVSNGDRKAATSADPLHPVVEIQTSLGNILVELDKSQAKLTVENFLRYVEGGHYNQTIFHQVLKDYVIMGGAYTEALVEKKAHPSIRNEAQRCALKNVAGTISMVRKPDTQDSATCQFFINVTDNPNLDYKGPNAEEYGYCPFGKITSGMDVVRKIAAVEVTDKTVDVPGKTDKAEFERVPKQAVVIQSIRFVR
jgi:cyclophilin family peptidyl-prolyl cis-trans isomerase